MCGAETAKSDVFPQIPKSAPTRRALAPREVAQTTRIQKISDSTDRGLSKTVPTAPLAPFPAELGAFEVWANLTKIGVATTENDVFDPKVSQTAEKIAFGVKNRVKGMRSQVLCVLGQLFRGTIFFTFGWVESLFDSRLGSKTRVFGFSKHVTHFHRKKCEFLKKIDQFSKNRKIQKISDFLTYSSISQPKWLQSYFISKTA